MSGRVWTIAGASMERHHDNQALDWSCRSACCCNACACRTSRLRAFPGHALQNGLLRQRVAGAPSGTERNREAGCHKAQNRNQGRDHSQPEDPNELGMIPKGRFRLSAPCPSSRSWTGPISRQTPAVRGRRRGCRARPAPRGTDRSAPRSAHGCAGRRGESGSPAARSRGSR
jgi:hypothetical protein